MHICIRILLLLACIVNTSEAKKDPFTHISTEKHPEKPSAQEQHDKVRNDIIAYQKMNHVVRTPYQQPPHNNQPHDVHVPDAPQSSVPVVVQEHIPPGTFDDARNYLQKVRPINDTDRRALMEKGPNVLLAKTTCVLEGVAIEKGLWRVGNNHMYVRYYAKQITAEGTPSLFVFEKIFEVDPKSFSTFAEHGAQVLDYMFGEEQLLLQENLGQTIDSVEQKNEQVAETLVCPEAEVLTETAGKACGMAHECNNAGETEKALVATDFALKLIEGAYRVSKACATGVLHGALRGAQTTVRNSALSLVHPSVPLIANCVLAFGDIALAATSFIKRVVVPGCSKAPENSTFSTRFLYEVGQTYNYCREVADRVKKMSYEDMAYYGGQFLGDVLFSTKLQDKLNAVCEKAKQKITKIAEKALGQIAYTFKHGTYVEAPYHHHNSGGRKSPPPKDGQRALDNSLSVSGKTFRIAIEDDKFVMLKETQKGQYHGYLIENSPQNWEKLDKAAREALVEAKLTTTKGRFLNENNT